jgi:hypothetical protein
MRDSLAWRIGVEFEWMAPVGLTRRSLAEALAAQSGGGVCACFHQQSEPSKVVGTPIFDNLTQGFEARDAAGKPIARCVDDLTLQTDFDRNAPPKPGWWRIVSDDARLLRLIARTGRADHTVEAALAPFAALFGSTVQTTPEPGVVRVVDEMRAPLALGAGLPGERERPCEVITPPLWQDQGHALSYLIETARGMGFGIPRESATHLHFDAAPLRAAGVFRRLVRLLREHGGTLKQRVGTNPHCRRLGDWPEALLTCVETADFAQLPWSEASARLQRLGLSKYCDFNLRNVVHDIPGKPTFEVRVLPGLLAAEPVLDAAALFGGLIDAAVQDRRWNPSAVM